MTAPLTPAQVLELAANLLEAQKGKIALLNNEDKCLTYQEWNQAMQALEDKARAAINQLGPDIPATLRAQAAALAGAQEREARLRQALEYYAEFDSENVSPQGQYWLRKPRPGDEMNPYYWVSDRGQTARAALGEARGTNATEAMNQIAEEEAAVSELLAALHGDSGEYEQRHGVTKAARDAMAKVQAGEMNDTCACCGVRSGTYQEAYDEVLCYVCLEATP